MQIIEIGNDRRHSKVSNREISRREIEVLVKRNRPCICPGSTCQLVVMENHVVSSTALGQKVSFSVFH